MTVKEAVINAKKYVSDLFGDEKVSNIGLEEVEFNEPDRQWIVTVGFSRPWDEPRNALAAIASEAKRSYKTVRISDDTAKVISVKNREAASAPAY